MTAPNFTKIKIVPLAHCIAHEGVVARWVEQIADNLLDVGLMKNPIIVTRAKGNRYIVIDGMHRFAALKRLGVPHILVYVIASHAPAIELAGWDALVFRAFRAATLVTALQQKYSHLVTVSERDAAQAIRAVDERRAVLAITDRRGVFQLLQHADEPSQLRARRVRPESSATFSVDDCVAISQFADRWLDEQDYKPLYVADTQALHDFATLDAKGLIIRPHYTKDVIVSRTLTGKLFPRKSTRHGIPGRPLRVDIALTLLQSRISLRAKNQLLAEHLRWCYDSDRIRYYPESVFVFSD